MSAAAAAALARDAVVVAKAEQWKALLRGAATAADALVSATLATGDVSVFVQAARYCDFFCVFVAKLNRFFIFTATLRRRLSNRLSLRSS